jgi:hypothetical protein
MQLMAWRSLSVSAYLLPGQVTGVFGILRCSRGRALRLDLDAEALLGPGPDH